MTAFNNVTSIVIDSINDAAGLGFEDFNFDGYPNPYPTIWCAEAPVHESGHQFGLSGDTQDNTFGVMSYGRSTYSFVERHINLMRHRVKSPGELGY